MSAFGFLALSVCAAFGAAGPLFQGFPKFDVRNIQVAWAAPTNKLAAALWVYKVLPQEYPPGVMSNLMALGSFTMHDSTNNAPGMLRFAKKAEGRYLEIVSPNGWVRYWDNKANDIYKKRIEGVPDEAETEARALALLAQIGISRSDLATKPGSSRLLTFGERGTNEHFDKAKRETVTTVYNRGIFFTRQLDGLNFAGIGVNGGAHVNFSIHGNLAWFEVVWRNLQRYELRKAASPEQIAKWIKEGKALMTHRNDLDPRDVKKVTVTEAAALYMGEPARSRQEFTYPFAQLEAVADLGYTNSPIQLYCPIITDEKVR